MDEAKKKCVIAPGCSIGPKIFIFLSCPTRGPNTPEYCMRLQPPWAGGRGRWGAGGGVCRRHSKGSASLWPVTGESGSPPSQGESWPEAPVKGVDCGASQQTRNSLFRTEGVQVAVWLGPGPVGGGCRQVLTLRSPITSTVGHTHGAQSPRLWYGTATLPTQMWEGVITCWKPSLIQFSGKRGSIHCSGSSEPPASWTCLLR